MGHKVRSAGTGWIGTWSSLKNNIPNKDGAFTGQQLAFCRHPIWEGEGGWDGCLCGPYHHKQKALQRMHKSTKLVIVTYARCTTHSQ